MVFPRPKHYVAYYNHEHESIRGVTSDFASKWHSSGVENWRLRMRRRFDELKDAERLTQAKLGEMLDVSQGAIGHWLAGRRSPDTLEAYERLAKALRVDPAWLLYGVDRDKEVFEAAQRLNNLSEERRKAIIALILTQKPGFQC